MLRVKLIKGPNACVVGPKHSYMYDVGSKQPGTTTEKEKEKEKAHVAWGRQVTICHVVDDASVDIRWVPARSLNKKPRKS